MKNYVLWLISYRFCHVCQQINESQINENKKGHQGLNPGDHRFCSLNVSINKKPFFFSQVVTSKNLQKIKNLEVTVFISGR